MVDRKPPIEAELLAHLKGDQCLLPPLRVVDVQLLATPAQGDALLLLGWRDRTFRFVVELSRLWTPKAVTQAAEAARRNASQAGAHPLILTPYLSEERLLELEAQGTSGLDLCGNGVVVAPGELCVLRTGFPNQFRWVGTIKNVYRKNSSVAARAFLLVPEFESLNEAVEQIHQRGGEVGTATVSKVYKSLEADLIIGREKGTKLPKVGTYTWVGKIKLPKIGPPRLWQRRLLQGDKLLDLLANNYAPPEVRRTFRGKTGLLPEELRKRLFREEENGLKVVLTGASSVERYAVMARESVQSFYCTDLEKVIVALGSGLRETDRFVNVEFLETQDNFVYFDRRADLAASPIQTYLELVNGDKRDQETAEQVRRVILGEPSLSARGGG